MVENRPIDVELVANDGARERPPVDPPELTPGSDDAARRRIALAAAAALVVGAAAGWALGRGAAPGESAPVATTPTTVVSAETTIGEVLPEPESEQDDEPDPEAPSTTLAEPVVVAPTTTVRGASSTVTVSSVEVPAPLAGVAAELVLTVSRTTLYTLDLPTGTLTERDVDRQPFGPPTLYAGDGWVLLPSWDGALPSTLIRDGERPVAVDVGIAWELLGLAGTDAFWRADKGLGLGRPGSVALIDVAGTPLGPVVELSEFPRLGDPAGGVLVEVAGDTFQATPDGAARVTTGELLATSATQAVVRECDAALVCGIHRVERGSGGRSDVPLDAALGPDPDLQRPWWPPGGAVLSPDGDALVTLWFQRDEERLRESLGVLDLTTGSFTEFAVNRDLTPFVWSPDGAFVVFVDGGRLFAFDRAAGTSFEVLPALVGVDTVAIRPPAD